jgi:4-hydroxy-3-methylbut-2-enyl diphosphate reductase
MEVILAESMGMCFGVRDAVELALGSPHRSELTILGQLVHNPEVLRRLDTAGIRSTPSPDAPVATARVMITAHGASNRMVARLKESGFHVEDATCPLVRHAHRSLMRLVDQGYFPVVVGDPNHVEVRGLVGDLDTFTVVPDVAAVATLAGRSRIGVVSQTTQPLERVLAVVEQIRNTFPTSEVRFVDTVCAPTKERQEAARRLGATCDLVIVVGGRNSNNSHQLLRTCEAAGARARQVESAADLLPEWFDGVQTVGLTAGTSTPDEVIAEVHNALEQIGRMERELAPLAR